MKLLIILLSIIMLFLYNSINAGQKDITIQKYEEKISPSDLIKQTSYNKSVRNQIQNHIDSENYDEAINKLLNIVKYPSFFTGREVGYLDLIYLLSINNKYTVSNYIINDFKSKVSNIEPDIKEWLDYIEIYNISKTATKEYDLINLINNFLNDNQNGLFTEHILFIKGNYLVEQKNIDFAIKTFELLYNMNRNSIYFQDIYPLLKFYYDNTGQYKLTENLILEYILSSESDNYENEYYWLGQYYDSLNEIKTAKKYYKKLALNNASALYPEALYWLGNHYKKINAKKSMHYFNHLSQFEGYENIVKN